MRVVIPESALKRARTCGAHLNADCPWWDAAEHALVYPNWDEAVEHYLTARDKGVAMLEWLVRHKLVPMTPAELAEKRGARGL